MKMTKREKAKFIKDLTKNVRDNLLEELSKYPKEWDGIELRWRIADAYSQVVFNMNRDKRARRYRNYENTVYTEGLY